MVEKNKDIIDDYKIVQVPSDYKLVISKNDGTILDVNDVTLEILNILKRIEKAVVG